MKGKKLHQDFSKKQGSHSGSKEKKNLYRQEKAKRIQNHQTSFTTNDKGISLGRKHERRKRPTIKNSKQLRKW